MAGQIAVIIPAYRAAWCIGDAIASALQQPEVAEVLVVDDASGDDTLDVAARTDDGTGRLKLLRQQVNQGPSAARNRAIAESVSPNIALLDADDRYFAGRFAALAKIEESWDFIADDILFAADAQTLEKAPEVDRSVTPPVKAIGLAEFAERNISKRGAHRSELGFIKPVMKRAFLERHGLRYNEQMRLGEDFILYAQALSKGARFLLAGSCGYGAIERPGSLSGNHSAEDLAALAEASRAVTAQLPPGPEREAMEEHAMSIEVKVAHRRFLDDKRNKGLVDAVGKSLGSPKHFAKVGWTIAQDKLVPDAPSVLPRRLFSREEFRQP